MSNFLGSVHPQGVSGPVPSANKRKKDTVKVSFSFRAGKGNTRLRALATRAEASPYGLEACASSAEIFQLCSRCSHVKNFSRTLFSAPSSFLSRHIKKKNHLERWFSFLEREKGILGFGRSLCEPKPRPTGLRLAPQVLKFFSYAHDVRM